MGAFYGSVHVRAADAATVLPHVEYVAKTKRARFLVAPSLGGWVAVYPEDGGQDQRVGAALAKRIGGHVVWVSVHDDDVFAYAVWKDGKLLDEYNSCPDCFGKVTAAKRKRMAGDPSAFAELLPADATAEFVKRALSGDAATQLEAFARHLGLPHVLTSYDYLMNGETEDVPEFSRFVHVPDRAAELTSRRRKEAATAEAIEQVRAAGLLLFDMAVSEPGPMSPIPMMTSGGGAGEFLYALSDLGCGRGGGDLFRLAPPYSVGPILTRIRLGSGVQDLCVSPSGRYLAVGRAAGGWSTELWDLSAQSLLREGPQARAIKFVGFSPNEEQLLSFSEGVVVVHDIRQGISREMRCPCDGRSACLHPADNTLVATSGQIAIALSDAATGNQIQRLVPALPSQQDQQAAINRHLARLREAAVSSEQLKAAENQLRALFATRPAMTGDDMVFALKLTSDGTRLICAALRSLRVYNWKALRSATGTLPVPLLDMPAETFEYEFRRRRVVSTGPVYNAVEVPSKRLILFSENSGVVRALNLDTGEVRPLVRPPTPGPLLGMQLSLDQRTLALVYRPTYEDAIDPTPYRIQIWNVERALAQPVDAQVGV